jgi:endonuclease G
MADVRGRLQERKLAAMMRATERWLKRREIREENRVRIVQGGEGAADSAERLADYARRRRAMQTARASYAAGAMPSPLERRIGAALNLTPYAPSDAAKRAGKPVARIVELRGAGRQPEAVASGFMVSPRLLLTNHHVIPDRAAANGLAAHFGYEQDEHGVAVGTYFEIDAGEFYLSDPELDFALVAVATKGREGGALGTWGYRALVEAVPKILIGQPVHIVQHPDGQPKQYAVHENRLIDLTDDGFLHYETDTLPGSSGSPAFSRDWEVVGLHHSAIPALDAAGRVLAIDGGLWDGVRDDQVKWIANEGIRVSFLVRHLAHQPPRGAAHDALLEDLLRLTHDPIDEMRAAPPQPVPEEEGGAALGTRITFTGPVTINVQAPAQLAPAPLPAPAPPLPVLPEKVIQFDLDYDNRKGYQADFLGVDVPPPTVAAHRLDEMLTDDNGDPLVLDYHHFSLAMNRKRRLCMWTASNVDYSPDRKPDVDREEFGSDKWIPDPRIPGEMQIFDADFYKPAKNIDRGHVVRREDNAWGEDFDEAEAANADTFHWTNCTPQHEAFNQSTPGRNDATYRGMSGIWGSLENHIQKELENAEPRACILAGPILARNDPRADFGRGKIQYPLRFWKVIVVVQKVDGQPGKRLRSFGFILDQSDVVSRFGIEFRVGRFQQQHVSLAKIEREAGVVFDGALHASDAKRD